MKDLQNIKQRFGIIGNHEGLNRAIDIAVQVAPTDLSVLITGESGTGKEIFPQVIHNYSTRKHGQYIAVNCGAIPEGTIDSELFGHEKGSLQEQQKAGKVILKLLMEVLYFLMKWLSCHCPHRYACCEFWKQVSSLGLVLPGCRKQM
jgi:transcriptional regulator of aromatic amino acid metabolism